MIKYNLIKEFTDEINLSQLPDVNINIFLRDIVDNWSRIMMESQSDFKLPNIPNVNYDITYRNDL